MTSVRVDKFAGPSEGTMLVVSLVVLWMSMWATGWAYSAQDPTLLPTDVPECRRKGTTLFCDYKNSAQMIYLEDNLDETLQVVVSNGHRLELSDSACFNVTVKNVTKVMMVLGHGYPCDAVLRISTTNSSLDRLPNHVSQVYLEDTHIDHLVTNAKLSELIVINSSINALNISRSPPDGINATFLFTSIDTLQELHIINGSNLVLQQTHIDDVPTRSLVIQEATVLLKESSTNTASADSVVMGPGATIAFKNYTGNLGVKTTTNLCPISASGHLMWVMPVHESPAVLPTICEPSVSYFSAYVTCLVFLIVEFIFITLGISYLSLREKPTTDSHCSKNNSNEVQDAKIIESKVTDDNVNWGSQNTIEEPLLQKLMMDDSQQYLQRIGELTEEICKAMQNQKSLLMDELKDFDKKCKAELDKIQDRKDKTLQLEETLINNEFQELEDRYKKEESKAKRNWDASTCVLKQMKDIKEMKEKIYVAKIDDEIKQVEHKTKIEVNNKEILRRLCHIGETLLVKWTVSSVHAHKTHPNLTTTEDLFRHIANLLIKEFSTKIHETEARDELQKYINNENIKKIKQAYDKRLKTLTTSHKTEQADLINKWQSEKSSDNVREKIKEFYDAKTQLLTISQKLDMKVLLYEYSENKPKLDYLNKVNYLQKKDISDVESILSLSAHVLKFYFKLMKEVVQSPNETSTESDA
ncbi:uncharacterized protein [Panulirus ornatus]|uniref:uncharacterized protein isoform X2 n=2 Tax=Panulirus ornatus TaxID=150431 RepID=UPI003A8BFA3A